MLSTLRTYLRKLKIVKPCPVKHYRKEDLDFIFNLYNTDYFTMPFENGEDLTNFQRQIKQLHEALHAHRNPDDKENSVQANRVFYNLGAMVQLADLTVYDMKDWRCFAIDALRFNCSEEINNLLDEYEYDDHILNHRLYLEAPLVKHFTNTEHYSDDWVVMKINNVRSFLSERKLKPVIADDYFNTLKNIQEYKG